MKSGIVLFSVGLAVTVALGSRESGPAAESLAIRSASSVDSEPSFYTVSLYDPKRDHAADLAMTVKRAAKEGGKTILVEVGGDWCGWCKLMTKYADTTNSVRQLLDKHYLVMKVNFSDANKNQKFLEAYPKIPGYPHIFVLDPTGKLLHSQNTAELEEGPNYNREKFIAFLEKWKPDSIAARK